MIAGRKILTVAVLAALLSVGLMSVASPPSDAAGTYSGGANTSTSVNPYDSVSFLMDPATMWASTIYVKVGGSINITGWDVYPSQWVVSSVTYGFGLSIQGPGGAGSLLGTISKAGTITIQTDGDIGGVRYIVAVDMSTPPPPVIYRTVYFETNGGSSVPSQSVQQAGKAVQPPNPTKSGFNFDGWFSDVGLTTPFNFVNTLIMNDTTIYAKWSGQSFTVSFIVGGGSYIAPQIVAYGTAATPPADPTRAGYVFTGWFSDLGLTVPFSFSTLVTTDIAIYAKWVDESTYQSTYPVASMTVNGSGKGLIAHAISTSTNADSVSWDFGDGSTAAVADVTHTYAAPGTYTITLTATNGAGSISATHLFKATDGDDGEGIPWVRMIGIFILMLVVVVAVCFVSKLIKKGRSGRGK